MAIVVQCFHCSTVLELDDGFRGGVCRCSQCGALLQVPKTAPSQDTRPRPAAPPAGRAQPRPSSPLTDPGLSRGPLSRGNTPDSPASSGAFSRSSMRAAAPIVVPRQSPADGKDAAKVASPAAGAARRRKKWPLWLGITFTTLALVIIAGVSVLSYFWLRGSDTTTHGTTEVPTPIGSAVVPLASGAQFLTVPLVGHRIIFSIDAGQSARDSFDYLRVATGLAAATLASDQEFRVALWAEDGTLHMIPDDRWAQRNDIFAIKNELDKVTPSGATRAVDAIKASLETHADQVIIVTAKSGTPIDSVAGILDSRQPNQRIDAIRIANFVTEPDAALGLLAERGNGIFLLLDNGKLNELTRGTR